MFTQSFRTFGGLVGGVWSCAETLLKDNASQMTDIEFQECQILAYRLCLILRTLQNAEVYINDPLEAQELLDMSWDYWKDFNQQLLLLSKKLGNHDISVILTKVSQSRQYFIETDT